MLELDSVSEFKIEKAVRRLETNEMEPMVFSSYTHAAFDQESRIITGDLRWKRFIEEAGEFLAEPQPLVWEMQPPGALNNIIFLVPTTGGLMKTVIRSNVSMAGWWREVTPQIYDGMISKILARDKWISARNFVAKQAQEFFSGEIADGLAERMITLESVYNQVLSTSLGKRLSEVSEELYRSLTEMIFGGLTKEFLVPKQSYFASEIGNRMTRQAIAGLNDKWLGEMIETLKIGRQTSVFIGTNGYGFMGISYNHFKDAYIRQSIDGKTGQAIGDTEIDSKNIAALLEQGSIRPTGVLFDPLMLMDRRLVIHDGNDYDNPRKAFMDLREEEGKIPQLKASYLQLFSDGQNSHPVVKFKYGRSFGEEIPSLATLFLWNIEPGFWNETLAKATQTGQTQSVDLAQEVKICC